MTVLQLLLTVLFGGLFVWGVWEVWDVWRDVFLTPPAPPKCACGRRILRDGDALLDNSDCQLHSVDVCMPEREVIW